MGTTVNLRKRKRRGRKIFLYLEYYPPLFNKITLETHQQESIHMFLWDKPKDYVERKHNRDITLEAESIMAKRILEITNDEYGFFDEKRLHSDFLAFFERYSKSKKHQKTYSSYLFFKEYVHGKCSFSDLSVNLCNGFADFLTETAVKKDGHNLHVNTVSAYFRLFKGVLAEAYRQKFLKTNIVDYVRTMVDRPTHREFLTMSEVIALNKTYCPNDLLRRAVMFSVLTGLRFGDIQSLRWENIQIAPDGGPCIFKFIQKSQREEFIFISHEALAYCGKPYQYGPVFDGLTKEMTGYPLKKWVEAAGIKKHITFHCFRHTFATLQIANGVDIYTVSHQLSHRFVSTTQIYADLVDEKRRLSANAISLLPSIKEEPIEINIDEQ